MVHKTLVGGTAYEINGGKTLVNGTVYNIKNGKTLVGGTAYEVGFGCEIFIDVDSEIPEIAPARLSSTVTINDVKYGPSSSDTTLSLSEGTVVSCNVAARGAGNTATVTVNGTVVAEVTSTSDSEQSVRYEYIVSTNATIRLTGWVGSTWPNLATYVIITEE